MSSDCGVNRSLKTLSNYPQLIQHYDYLKSVIKGKINESTVDVNGVYPNNELNLADIEIYGFDYDYTLAVYKESIDYLIYNLVSKVLQYPIGIHQLDYVPEFAIRGLHYDIENGLLMKIDSFHQIQKGSVYRGITKISDKEVEKIYGDLYISQSLIRPENSYPKMKQLIDLFSVPEICLLANVTEYFNQNNISYHPEILFYDVQNAVQSIHPLMHGMLDEEKIKDYLQNHPQLQEFLLRLKKANKKMFLITNSPYNDCGMKYMIGDGWTDLFDLIIVHARKPKFFVQEHRPFRQYHRETDCHLWEQVTKFEKDKVYMEGTVKQLLEITGWKGNNILYFGDQIYSDLADLTLYHGWRTGAVIKELEKEINTLNSEDFAEAISELQAIQQLIEEHQKRMENDARGKDLLKCLLHDRDLLRKRTKELFNPQFGSIFRTHHNPTYFSRRLFRYSDIYTAQVTNLLNYSVNHLFCPRRGFLPHERSVTSKFLEK
ncbi:nucleotidase domain-containing protein 3 [Dinothrombium tinctorium]|uniref:Nucleotidase domain-containing protein 3 n=1 Tax=Dinothrombium tinctorium TaxID=1965070 RepID=A0A443R9W7_9ACAR|nr:nucleotidase domain-containing protein 3-like protein [Dinothrombium tinctorium]RWS12137.1 nucleotidase domain-containing protein 3-like protein [Dinothrombium tinctorium]RWS12170.1 nucleotidase domain-containing protein 3 [Dinothrombium tinctorium]